MEFITTEHVKKEDEQAVLDGLMEYNKKNFETVNWKDVGIYLENEKGEKTAGLIGFTHGKWLMIQYLWVSEALRGSHIGSGLLKKAEEIAKERGCQYSFLDTFEFQAPKFYEKYGYRKVFVLNEYPLTGKHYYMKKEL